MKKFNPFFRHLLIGICLIFLFCCCGCEFLPTIFPTSADQNDPIKQHYQKDPAAYVVFMHEDNTEEVYIPLSEIQAYKSKYADCNSTWYKNQLSGEDIWIYNAFLYAMEHSFSYFSLYVENNQKDFHYIRQAVSLDSPFLEQNVNRNAEHTYTWEPDHAGQRIAFRLEQFTEERWQLKMEALKKCKEIVANIPDEYVTQLQKMEYLYNYVCENVTYVAYDDLSDQDYLYDAACGGQTVCDGYSNMLCLLLNLIDVECCESMGSNIADIDQATEEELANGGGHTWVVAKIDGVFYNFDPTFEDTAGEFFNDTLQYFGFSDDLISVKYFDCDALRPKCTDTSRDFSYADLTVENIIDDTQIKKIAEFTDSRAKNGIYDSIVLVKSTVTDKEYQAFVDKYIGKVNYISRVSTSMLEFGNCCVIKLQTEAR